MIQIKPNTLERISCSSCGNIDVACDVLWQGIHVLKRGKCDVCKEEIFEDIKVGQALFTPFKVTKKGLNLKLFGEYRYGSWYGVPLLESLRKPKAGQKINFRVEVFFEFKKVVVLNCIDYLYGHSLLKLLNSEHYINSYPDVGLILIIPRFLRWMIPDGVAEVWTVDIPLLEAKSYYPEFDRIINNECGRFETIYLSVAHSHPRDFDITRFTKINKHNFGSLNYRITYVWREDRFWVGENILLRFLYKYKITFILFVVLFYQKYKIVNLFSLLRKDLPEARYTICGFGERLKFPAWIEDRRTSTFAPEIERTLCSVYSESRIVLGIHGSNMLLPSAHAGLALDLMPSNRWLNMAQDILYQKNECCGLDLRLVSWRYRYVPIDTALKSIAIIIRSMIMHWATAVQLYEAQTDDKGVG